MKTKTAKPATIHSVAYYRVLDRTGKPDNAVADMLRYDRAFVHPKDFTLVADPTIQTKQGRGRNGPTLARWNSFGQRLDLLALSNDAAEFAGLPTLRGDWITFVHPRDDQGREDFARLVPQTLDEYLAAAGAEAAKFR